jgi:D-3-phosphoglycerate dehydrogenase
MSDFLVAGGVTNAINMPSLSAEEAPRLKPYMTLAEKLGKLVGQVLGEGVRSVAVEVEGAAAELNPKPITGAVLAGLMGSYSQTVNMVNAPVLAKERGLDVREVRHDREGDYHTLVRVTAGTSTGERSVAGTLFGNKAPRLVEMFGVGVEAELAGAMLYIVNDDSPGFIGKLGTTLGEAGINIATFNLGRRDAGGEAVALVAVDGEVSAEVVGQLCGLAGVREVVPLRF